MNGIFEGTKGNYYFKFEVRQEIIDTKGQKTPPVFTVYFGIFSSEPVMLTDDVRGNGGRNYSVNETIILINEREPGFTIEARYFQGTKSSDDRYEVNSFLLGGPPFPDFETVTLNRIK
jgi:hypothetical protein